MKQKLLALFFLCVSSFASANTVTLSYVDSGWYDNTGSHYADNTNYIAGFYNGLLFRNFFVFDTSGVSGQITSAKLRINTGHVETSGPYYLQDVTTDVATLRAGGFGLFDIFNDLGNGVSYGTADLSVDQRWTVIDIDLTADAIAALNSADGLFAIAGKYGSGTWAFGATHLYDPVRELILEVAEVPEPLPIALLGIGLLGAVVARKRKKA